MGNEVKLHKIPIEEMTSLQLAGRVIQVLQGSIDGGAITFMDWALAKWFDRWNTRASTSSPLTAELAERIAKAITNVVSEFDNLNHSLNEYDALERQIAVCVSELRAVAPSVGEVIYANPCPFCNHNQGHNNASYCLRCSRPLPTEQPPSRLYVQLTANGGTVSHISDPRKGRDDGRSVYVYALTSAPSIRSSSADIARRIAEKWFAIEETRAYAAHNLPVPHAMPAESFTAHRLKKKVDELAAIIESELTAHRD